jgi:hypothetical protein
VADDAKSFGHQTTFLYKALDDNQNLIRFLDAKAAFVVALLSAMLSKVLTDLGKYFPRGEQPIWRQLLVFSFFAAVCVAAFIVARILFPTNNPVANTRLLPHAGPRFYLSELQPKRFPRIFSSKPFYSQLAEDHQSYVESLLAADEEVILKTVAGEVLKISYIRQIKMERFTYLARVLAVSVLLFVFLVAADATSKKIESTVPIQIRGTVQVDLTPQKVPINPPAASRSSDIKGNKKSGSRKTAKRTRDQK